MKSEIIEKNYKGYAICKCGDKFFGCKNDWSFVTSPYFSIDTLKIIIDGLVYDEMYK